MSSNTFIVKAEDTEKGTSAVEKFGANKVTITLASGRTLAIYATWTADVLACYVSGDGESKAVIYPQAYNSFKIELR